MSGFCCAERSHVDLVNRSFAPHTQLTHYDTATCKTDQPKLALSAGSSLLTAVDGHLHIHSLRPPAGSKPCSSICRRNPSGCTTALLNTP